MEEREMEERELKDKMGMRAIVSMAGIPIAFVIGIGGLYYVSGSGIFGNHPTTSKISTSKTIVETSKSPVVETKHEGKIGKVDDKLGDYGTYDTIHQVANNLIIPIDGNIIGRIEPSPATLDALLVLIDKASEGLVRPDIVETIKDWRKGNFRDVVKVHNWAWSFLEGNLGEAGQPNEKAIKGYLEKYDYSK